MPEEAVKPLPLTDAEIDLVHEIPPDSGIYFVSWGDYNALREQLEALETASLTGLMDENAALKAKLAAAVRLASLAVELHQEATKNFVGKELSGTHYLAAYEGALNTCLSLGMGEALGLGEV